MSKLIAEVLSETVLPITWEYRPLGDIAEITMGNSPPGESYNDVGKGVPLVNGPVEFSDGAFGSTRKIKFTTSPTKMCRAGDFLICVRGSTTGRTNVASFDACIGRGVASIRASLCQSYLNHFIRTLEKRIHALGKGSTFPSISQQQLAELSVPIPCPDDLQRSTEEQKRIAGILDQADAIRRKRQEVETHFDELLKSTFIQMFGNPIRNPMEWDVEPLGVVATLDRGKSRHRPRDAKFLYGGLYPLVQTGDITNSNGFVRNYSQTYSEEGLAQSRLWPAGTLCITIAANIGKTAVLTFDACFPDSVVGLIAGEKLTIEYVRHWFVAMEKATDAAATQVAQKNINLEYLRNLKIQVPSLAKQQQFSSAVNKIRQARGNAEIAHNEASGLFNSLVQRAFEGKL